MGVVIGCGMSFTACGQSSPSSSGPTGTGGAAGGGAGQSASGGAAAGATAGGQTHPIDSTGGGSGSGAGGGSGSGAGGGSGSGGGNVDAGPADAAGAITPPTGRKRYLYAGNGGTVNVYDIDNGHTKVKSISPPHAGADLRGICGSVQTHAFYLSYFGPGRVVAVDMLTDTEIWSQDMNPAADRGSISLDGTKLFVPAGEDFAAPYDFVLDPATGMTLTQFMITAKAHDTDIGASGKYAYLETKSSPIVSVVDIATDKIIRQLTFGGVVGPHVVDSADKYIYGNVFDWFGFEMADVTTGQVVARVQAMDLVNPGNGGGGALRNHGIALKPDETELWLASKFSPSLFVFDNTVMPPKQVKRITVGGGYGYIHWITFTIDGSYLYPAPDQNSAIPVQVYDTKTYQPTGATLAHSEDMFEVDFADGKVVAVGNQYGIGRKIPGP
jgi:hypothetical protein